MNKRILKAAMGAGLVLALAGLAACEADSSYEDTYSENTPLYGISLSRNGTLTFEDAAIGYGARTPVTLGITNTGTMPTGDLTLSLSDGAAFALSRTAIDSIPSGGSTSFQIVPNTGLPVGTYRATVIVSSTYTGGATASNIGPQSFDVRFTVTNADGAPPEGGGNEPAPADGIALDAGSGYTFPEAIAGYGPQTELAVSITNTGSRTIGSLAIALSDAQAFRLNKEAIAEGIETGGRASFTVVPVEGLGKGTYTATVTVSGLSGTSVPVSASFTVSFTVTATYGIGLDVSGTHVFPLVITGYGEQQALTVNISNTGNQPTGSLAIALSNPQAFALDREAVEEGIAVGGSGVQFTISPRTGLGADTYTAIVTVGGAGDSASNIETQSFAVTFTVEEPRYGISLDMSGTHIFPPAVVGYYAQTALRVNITNTGNQPTGGLTVTLTGADAFSVGPATAIADIEPGAKGYLTIVPVTGRAVGTYYATVTVSGDEGISASFGVSFEVETVPVYSYEFSKSGGGDFGKKTEGYSAIAPVSVTLRNTGSRTTGVLTVALADEAADTAGTPGVGAFELTDAAFSVIPAGGQTVFKVGPRHGLTAAGRTVYTARLTVTSAPGAAFAVNESIDLKFIVVQNWTVSFNVNGGSPSVPTQTIEHGNKATRPPTVGKQKLRLDGWYANGQTDAFDFDAPVTANAALKAVWVADISFDLKGGTGGGTSVSSRTLTEGTFVSAPTGVTKNGLRLDGWYTAAGAKFDFAATPITGHTAFTAKWVADVTFNANGGTVSGSAIPTQVINEGGLATRPVPSKPNLRFVGWFRNLTDASAFNFSTPVTAHVTLNAKWEADVTFNSNGGSGVLAQIINENGTAAEAWSSKSGLRLKGWYRSLSDTSPFTFDTPITAHITLYAKWEADVTFDSTGGSAVALQTVDEGGVATQPSTARANAGFEGWYTAGYAAKWNFSSAVNGHTTLYAKWTPYAFGLIAECAAQETNAAFATYTLTNGSETYTSAFSLTTATGPDIIVIDGSGRTVTGNGNIVTVGSGVTLTLKNITLTKIPVIVSAGGKLVLETGAVIEENSGTGVTVNSGTLEMKPGTLITKNTASGVGGGVRLNGGTFTMSGGEISENTSEFGGGVRLNGGTFTMSGGKISDNTSPKYGGGVYADSGVFTMTGGDINGNKADKNGGGVDMRGTFTMTAGKISGNTAGDGGGGSGEGGGVMLSGANSVFNLSGSGDINGNTASLRGGGVRIAAGGNPTFNMSGGTVRNNSAGTSGGGLQGGGSGSVFHMTGGYIKENRAPADKGGGVYIASSTATGNPSIGSLVIGSGGSVYDNIGGDWH